MLCSRRVFDFHVSVAAVILLGTWRSLAAAGPLTEPITPLPQFVTVDREMARLGRQLFVDVRLSGNNQVSCASCHDLSKGGADGRAHSIGFNGKPTPVNAPTVLNAAFNFAQTWNGRADSLETQVEMVVRNPIVMGASWDVVVRTIGHDAGYQRSFGAAFRDGVTAANIQSAIATYERTLVTPNSRFDRYLRGEQNALTAGERAGYFKFKQYGCIACHQGINVGGNMFQKFGVMGDYFENRGSPTDGDLGRFLVTQEEQDKHVFKVPSLRNVALTAPYFHDGTAKTLGAAVDVMFKYQLGRVASDDDKAAIVSFLNTLTAEVSPDSPL